MTKPPLHTLPHNELMAKLDTFTKLLALRDETSCAGWSLEVGPRIARGRFAPGAAVGVSRQRT